MFQRKEQDKKPQRNRVSNLPDQEFKVMVMKMLIELGKGMVENSEL